MRTIGKLKTTTNQASTQNNSTAQPDLTEFHFHGYSGNTIEVTVLMLLAQSVTNQNNQPVLILTNANGGSVAARVRDFVKMNPPEFLGLQTGEDPQNFIDEVKKIFGVMQVTRNDRVELESYQLKDVAHIWYTQ
uniref:Gag-pol polyprotein n=1 Tax=Solanum tuberosum TaxID=4113 RepID=M1DM16_SOLTU